MSSDTNQNRDVSDALTKDWWIDKAMAAVMWVGGISAIVAIVGIFIFITKEGAGFFATAFEVEEFLGSPLWRPTSEENPTYGTLALIAGTASVTGFAVLMAVPFSFGAAIYISEFAPPKTKETLKVLVELLAAIPRCLGLHRAHHHEPADHRGLRSPCRTQRLERWNHPGPDGCTHHVHHR